MHTTDAGRDWSASPAPAPAVAFPSGQGTAGASMSVRFADPMDGWIYAMNPARVWSTHDGGKTWARVQSAGLTPSATITAMEASGGYVWVAVIPPGFTNVHLERSPVGTDSWTDIDTGVPVGAGPVPSTQLVLHGPDGWLLEDDRTVVGGLVPLGEEHGLS